VGVGDGLDVAVGVAVGARRSHQTFTMARPQRS
jgi:hypothetical protein